MGKAYKNFWSLNTDEAVVTGILRDETSKDIEVLMPINAQMKDVDLVLMNFESKKTKTIQVKGSRAYEPKRGEIDRFGKGSAGWFMFSQKVIDEATADFFIFLIYILEENKFGRREIVPHTITIPTSKLKKLYLKFKTVGKSGKYNSIFWIDYEKKQVFDLNSRNLVLSEYLDEKGFEILRKELL